MVVPIFITAWLECKMTRKLDSINRYWWERNNYPMCIWYAPVWKQITMCTDLPTRVKQKLLLTVRGTDSCMEEKALRALVNIQFFQRKRMIYHKFWECLLNRNMFSEVAMSILSTEWEWLIVTFMCNNLWIRMNTEYNFKRFYRILQKILQIVQKTIHYFTKTLYNSTKEAT